MREPADGHRYSRYSNKTNRCPECGFDWTIATNTLPREIATIGRRYRATVSARIDADGFSIESLRANPAPGIWSVVEYLAHVRDVTTFFEKRIERVLTEDRPQLPTGVRFRELGVVRAYQEEDPLEVLATIERKTFEFGSRMELLSSDAWDRVGLGSLGDERSVLVLARRLAHEAQHHLLDIERGLQ